MHGMNTRQWWHTAWHSSDQWMQNISGTNMQRDVRRCNGLITAWLLWMRREMGVTEWPWGSFRMEAEQDERKIGNEWGRVRRRSMYLGRGCAVLLGEGRSRQHLQRGLPWPAAAAAMTLRAEEGKENKTLRPVSHRKAILAEHTGAWPYKNHKSSASTLSFKITVLLKKWKVMHLNALSAPDLPRSLVIFGRKFSF